MLAATTRACLGRAMIESQRPARQMPLPSRAFAGRHGAAAGGRPWRALPSEGRESGRSSLRLWLSITAPPARGRRWPVIPALGGWQALADKPRGRTLQEPSIWPPHPGATRRPHVIRARHDRACLGRALIDRQRPNAHSACCREMVIWGPFRTAPLRPVNDGRKP